MIGFSRPVLSSFSYFEVVYMTASCFRRVAYVYSRVELVDFLIFHHGRIISVNEVRSVDFLEFLRGRR